MEVKKKYYSYNDLMDLLQKNGKNYSCELIGKAYKIAYEAHKNQKRVSGISYIFHPVSVAYILAELGMDTQCIVAALLHDIIEDTLITKEFIEDEFGATVANLVDGVTKLRQKPSSSHEEQQAENIKKMLLAMSNDIRVIMIKLADRLQNMRTIECMDPKKQREKSLQNMEVYAPLAHRLGIRTIKDELEDISLRYIDPVAYLEIENSLALKKDDREKFIGLIKKRILDRFQKFMPEVYVEGRVKSANEIYKKMFIKGRTMDQIYDIYAVRIIVNNVNDCYNAFGIVHDMFQPIPNRFKDYISTPKPNRYQSLHTTVLSNEGIAFEIQIRTWEMHHTAEYGIAAHWKYKLGSMDNNAFFSDSLSWVKKFADLHKETNDVTDVVGNIKSDLIPKEVFALTPKGKVIALPKGSTVIDFAYALHTDLGHKMQAAKVNQKIVPAEYELGTGEIVEIITSEDAKKGPSREWINVAKTSEARNKIRQWFKKERHSENIVDGRKKTYLELHKNGINIAKEHLEDFIAPVLSSHQCKTANDFFAAVSYGGIQLWKMMPQFKKEFKKKFEESSFDPADANSSAKSIKISKNTKNIIVDGQDNCPIKLSHCCNPLPGDKIVGFVTKGHGISIHKVECQNIVKLNNECDEGNRWIRVKWSEEAENIFETTVKVIAYDTPIVLRDVMQTMLELHIKLKSVNSQIVEQNKIELKLIFGTKNLNHLKYVMKNLMKIKDVVSVERGKQK